MDKAEAYAAVTRAGRRHWPLLVALALSAFLEVFRLNQEGLGNLYYAAAVKSMLGGWHNFFFASFDPGGFVSVDKPPLALWLQTASARLFGLHGLSLLLPEAIAGVISVALLYHLIERAFGRGAGLLSALALATMPINVVTSRNNAPDSLLVVTSLLAAWAVSLAAERGRLLWLLVGFGLVGVGFNIKMLEAFLVLPAFFVLYLLAAHVRWRARFVHLALASLMLLLVSLCWAVAVDLTPAGSRPYVGSSTTNSELNLILGYNGLDRLLPGRSFFTGHGRPPPAPPPSAAAIRFAGIGPPGPLRLVDRLLAGQIGWLLPLAVLGLVVLTCRRRWQTPFDRRQIATLLWGAWLVTGMVYFSVANEFQAYYLVMLAPAIAALAGAGAVALWDDFRSHRMRGWLLPAALAGTALWELKILADFPAWSWRLVPAILAVAALSVAVLVTARLVPRLRGRVRLRDGAAATGLLVLLIAPAVWAAIPVWQGGTLFPLAGPDSQPAGGRTQTAADGSILRAASAAADDLLNTSAGHDRFLAATPYATVAAPLILVTGRPVMALGGYTGADPILTPTGLAHRVATREVGQYLLGGPAQRDLADWIVLHCVHRVSTDLGGLYVCGPGG